MNRATQEAPVRGILDVLIPVLKSRLICIGDRIGDYIVNELGYSVEDGALTQIIGLTPQLNSEKDEDVRLELYMLSGDYLLKEFEFIKFGNVAGQLFPGGPVVLESRPVTVKYVIL